MELLNRSETVWWRFRLEGASKETQRVASTLMPSGEAAQVSQCGRLPCERTDPLRRRWRCDRFANYLGPSRHCDIVSDPHSSRRETPKKWNGRKSSEPSGTRKYSVSLGFSSSFFFVGFTTTPSKLVASNWREKNKIDSESEIHSKQRKWKVPTQPGDGRWRSRGFRWHSRPVRRYRDGIYGSRRNQSNPVPTMSTLIARKCRDGVQSSPETSQHCPIWTVDWISE